MLILIFSIYRTSIKYQSCYLFTQKDRQLYFYFFFCIWLLVAKKTKSHRCIATRKRWLLQPTCLVLNCNFHIWKSVKSSTLSACSSSPIFFSLWALQFLITCHSIKINVSFNCFEILNQISVLLFVIFFQITFGCKKGSEVILVQRQGNRLLLQQTTLS